MFSPMVKKSVSVALGLFVVVFSSGTGYPYPEFLPLRRPATTVLSHAAPQTRTSYKRWLLQSALYPDSLVAKF